MLVLGVLIGAFISAQLSGTFQLQCTVDIIDRYGADALRYTMAFLAPLGQDVLLRLLYGARISLLVGITSTLCAVGIGILINRMQRGEAPQSPSDNQAKS